MNIIRMINLLGLAICALVLGVSFYVENVLSLHPCSLCLLQRAAFGLLALLFIMSFFHQSSLRAQKFYSRGGLLLSLVGAALAARQLWLQHQPLSVLHSCLPRFSYVMENTSLNKTLGLFKGNTQCSEFVWTYSGISLAGWALISFGVLMLLLLIKMGFDGRLKSSAAKSES